MAHAALRPRFGLLLIVLALCQFAMVGCNGGPLGGPVANNNTGGPGNPVDPFAPLLLDVDPPFGDGGAVITLEGFNFSPILEQNIVTFVGSGITLNGVVTAFQALGQVPNLGERTTIDVLVPTGVRTGTVRLAAPRADNGVLETGGLVAFTGAPVITGTLFGNEGNLGYFSLGTAVIPDQVVLVGWNLDAITSATFTDSGQTEVDADVTPGTGGTNVVIPTGMSAVTVDFPGGLVINCFSGQGNSDTLEIAVTDGGSAPQALVSNPVQVQITDQAINGVPAMIPGCLVPSGVRRGDIPITFSLLQDPAEDRWDVIPMYEDALGNPQPCTARIPDGAPSIPDVYNGEDLLPGDKEHVTGVPGLIAPGAAYTFVWDSEADLGGQLVTTRLSLQPGNPDPGGNSPCRTTIWTTPTLVIDNSTSLSGAIVETFATSQFLDSPSSTALWGPQFLTGNPSATQLTPTGQGTVDIVCEALRTYFFNLDTGEITDETIVGGAIFLLTSAQNPGAALNEFHVRSIVIEDGADIQFVGDRPLIIRCSGTGDVSETVARFDVDLDFNGEPGTAASLTDQGVGGNGVFGGGDGGDGGAVEIQGDFVVDVTHAQAGFNFGGEPGETVSYVRASAATVGRAGAGGGGGHLSPGEDGTIQSNVAVYALPGKGGRARGDSRNTQFAAGSGGGGGGGIRYRGGTTQPVSVRQGAGGGGGGGVFACIAGGTVEINGTITCNGGNGGVGFNPAGGHGGGGSGGSITVRAAGNIVLGDNSLLLARGGAGGFNSFFSGGDGSDGRIVFESNGAINLPGLVNLQGIDPPIGAAGISAGLSAAPVVPSSPAPSGSLNMLGAAPGEYVIDTDANQVVTPANTVFFQSPLGFTPGVFEFVNVNVPLGIVLRAVGSNPLVIRVAGACQFGGTLDASGFDGGEVDVTDALNPLPGLGGLGGPGGGDGGDGGFADGTATQNGSAGGLPANLPSSIVAPSPLGGGTGGGLPVPPGLAVEATGGITLTAACGAGDSCIAGSGGGGAFRADGGDATGGQVGDGRGARAYGSNLFLNPEGGFLRAGGSGGAGGGGNATGDGINAHIPGTGGGGGGGYIEFAVVNSMTLQSSAQILANGGDAFRSLLGGGNGGAGAAGGIFIRVNGLLILETGTGGEGPLLQARAGVANSTPIGYTGNTNNNGGSASNGRIRIEGPAGVNAAPPNNCNTNPTSGVCPPPSVGTFTTFGTVRSRARSLSYRVTSDGAQGLPSVFQLPTIDFGNVPGGTDLQVVFSGANESLDVPGTPDAFAEGVDDVSNLRDSEFIRMDWFLYSVPLGPTPTVDSISLPVDFIAP